jgi:hypothetical protein
LIEKFLLKIASCSFGKDHWWLKLVEIGGIQNPSEEKRFIISDGKLSVSVSVSVCLSVSVSFNLSVSAEISLEICGIQNPSEGKVFHNTVENA